MEDRCRNAPMLIGIGRAFSRHTAIDDDDTLRVRNDVKRDRHFIGAIALVHLDIMNLEFDRAGLEHEAVCLASLPPPFETIGRLAVFKCCFDGRASRSGGASHGTVDPASTTQAAPLT
jgi:hypothetical protein